jgi:hypothetical protein
MSADSRSIMLTEQVNEKVMVNNQHYPITLPEIAIGRVVDQDHGCQEWQSIGVHQIRQVSPHLQKAQVFELICALACTKGVAALHIQKAEIDAFHRNTWMGLDTCSTITV